MLWFRCSIVPPTTSIALTIVDLYRANLSYPAEIMDGDTASSSANFFGIVTGGGALLGIAFYRAHLPKWRYRALEDALKRTEEMWTQPSRIWLETTKPENV